MTPPRSTITRWRSLTREVGGGKRPKHVDRYEIDLRVWYGSHYVRQLGIHDLAKSVDEIVSRVKSWTEHLNGIRVYTVDLERYEAEIQRLYGTRTDDPEDAPGDDPESRPGEGPDSPSG